MAVTFRKKSLEKLSSPEQLDTMIEITSRGSWIALATVGFCLVVAVAWGIWGSVPSKLTGTGILLNPKGLIVVTAPGTGVLESLDTEIGTSVLQGNLIGIISHPEEQQALNDAARKLRDLEAEQEELKEDERLRIARKNKELDLSRSAINLEIGFARSRIERLEKRIENQKELLNLGLITLYDLSSTEDERDKVLGDIAATKNRLVSLENAFEQARQDSWQALEEMAERVRQAGDVLAEKQVGLQQSSMVTAPYDGIVVGIGAVQGERVNTGDELVTLERTGVGHDGGLRAVQFYPAATAKKIQVGMITQVSPGTVDASRYGYLLARVASVAKFPATLSELRARLQNDELVSQIERLGVVLEVASDLVKDPATLSGYKWTSSSGPPFSLQAGTPCTASVVIEENPPITLVVPMLREILLGTGKEKP